MKCVSKSLSKLQAEFAKEGIDPSDFETLVMQVIVNSELKRNGTIATGIWLTNVLGSLLSAGPQSEMTVSRERH